MSARVVTANALVEGDVVYLASGGHWARHLHQAAVFTDATAQQAALEAATARSGEVVGAYLIDVDIEDGLPQPTHFREAFRKAGPSNRFHGKQAEQTE